MNYLRVFCCLLFLTSCNNQEPSAVVGNAAKTGVYLSHKPGPLEYLYRRGQGIKKYGTGFELSLKKDATYHMISCAYISDGHWWSDSGKLYLQEKDVNWRLDTFRRYGFKGKWPEPRKETWVFVIKDNLLYTFAGKNSIIILKYKQQGRSGKPH